MIATSQRRLGGGRPHAGARVAIDRNVGPAAAAGNWPFGEYGWEALRARYGEPVAILSCFHDPKPDLDRAARVLVSSWFDSGINAISVLARLVRIGSPLEFRGDWLTGTGRLSCSSNGRPAAALIETTWTAEELVKLTQVTFSSGAVLELDHRSASARIDVTPLFAADAAVEPALGRYRSMLRGHLDGGGANLVGRSVAARLHDVVAEAGRAALPPLGYPASLSSIGSR